MTEPLPGGDILQDVPLEDLHLLISLLKSRLGRSDSTFMVNFLKNALDWHTRFPGDRYVTVMAPHGDWRTHCTFVGDCNMPSYTALVIFSLDDSNQELASCLLATKRINWDGPRLFAMVPERNCAVVYRLAEALGLAMEEDNYPCYAFRIDSEEAIAFDTTSSVNTKLAKLSQSDSQLVNDEWPHRTHGSEKYIEASIARNDSVGLFIEDTGELASWAFVNFLGALACLQTVPGHKRKGFGKIVTKAMAARMARKGLDPYGTILTTNAASMNLFYSLGFKPQSQLSTFFFCEGTKTSSL